MKPRFIFFAFLTFATQAVAEPNNETARTVQRRLKLRVMPEGPTTTIEFSGVKLTTTAK
jgi:hypothetical protein